MKVAQAVLQGSLKLRLVPHFPLMRAMYACISEIIDSEVDDLLITGQLAESFGGFFSYLPDEFFIACEEFFANVDTDFDATPSVPAYAIVKDCGKAILDLVRPLFHRDILERGLFPELRKQLLDNENAASEISQVDRILGKKKIIGSDKYDAEPDELVRLYLRHTPFYQFLHARVPFRIPRSTYAEHGALFAKSGHGKTQTLRAIVAGFLQEEDPPALFIMDSLGSLIEGIAEL